MSIVIEITQKIHIQLLQKQSVSEIVFMDILFLTTAMQHSAKNPFVELNVKRLKDWVDKLPVMEVIETVTKLQNAIESFNEIQIDNSSRLKLLEVYRHALESVIFLYDNKRLDMLPITQQEKDFLGDDIMWLYLSLAKGYKKIVMNNINSKVNLKSDLVFQLSIFRAMELLMQSGIYAFCSHKSVSHLVYLEVNQIYLYMESIKCLDLKIRTRESYDNINDLYKQFMFIATIDPYRFNSDEIIQLQLILHDFSKYIEVKIESDCVQSEGKYIVDLNEDLVPIYSGRVNDNIDLPTIRTININMALKKMLAWVNKKNTEKVNLIENKDIQFIKQLFERIGYDRIRKENRVEVYKKVRVAVGLSAVSYFLDSIDNILQACSDENDKVGNDEKINKHVLQQWKIEDECNHGRKLSVLCDDVNGAIKIGELIGVIETLKSDSGFHPVMVVGILRWKRKFKGYIKYGVEIIPGIPHHTKKIVSKNTNEQYSGIYFPAEDVLSRPPALIVEKSVYQHKKQLDITIKNKIYLISMGGIFTESSLYVQCEFSNLTEWL